MKVSRADTTAAPTWLPLGKKKFRLSPMRERDFGEFERWVQARRVKLVIETLPAMQSDENPDGITREERLQCIKHAQDQCMHIVWHSVECSRAMETLDGAAMLLWLHTHRHHDETPDELLALLTDMDNLGAVLDVIDDISLAPLLNVLKRMDDDPVKKKKARAVASHKARAKTAKRKKAKRKKIR